MLIRRQPLVAEKDDFVFVEQPDDLLKHGIVEVLRQIDTEDFCAERRA